MRPRLVLSNNVGGHTATVLDVDALFPGPAADRGGVDDAAGAAAAGGSPGGAADLAGVVDVCPQRGVELVGVLSAQVDFIVSTVQAEPDGASRLAAVDVIDVESLHFLSHDNCSVRG